MYKLLIADDEQLERQAIRFIVERHCPDITLVGEAGDGESAVRLAERERPDIVLMDIRMPEMDGLEATREIRILLPDAKVIILTAFDEFDYAKQALMLGAANYLLKPTRPDDLVQALLEVTAEVGLVKSRQEEEARLRQSLAEAIPFIQMSFVYDLISGNIVDPGHFRERSRFLGLLVDPGVALVVDVDNFKQLTMSDSELQKQIVKQAIYKNICSVTGYNGLVTPFGSDSIVVLLGFENGENQDVVRQKTRKMAEAIRDTLNQDMGISVTIGIGRYYTNPLDIHKSYVEAVNAHHQRFFLGDSQIIPVEEVPHLRVGPFIYPFHYERAVLDKVRCGERKAARDALDKLLKEMFASQTSIETVKACVLELLIVLSRAAVEGGANLDQLTLLNFDGIRHLVECHSQEKIYRWMMESLDRFLDNMLESRSGMNRRVINKACEYIVQNCHKNVSLEEIAQTIHLSPFYFSRLFKQEKGCNFVDYLTKARIEKAKRLLRNQDYTVVRVAAESGYQDASYFCRVFRHEVGVTPNQYRRGLRSQQDKLETK
ncbi:transcription regulator hth arac- type [Lucifera butyrica]|uniref:Transcription regulator hth arac- type n=1 Tax=Lucifera butyrica TaxID=1351585 RepID=A0A498R1P6_9FIRM|nr:response regulator [Lucifera butyrica]VBB05291.1 transcription regulator hth arac- type [Lucifera butyrica]